MSSSSRSPANGGINPAYTEQSGYDTSDDRYPPDWDARKDAVKQRDDDTCMDCGSKSGHHTPYGEGKVLHVHHINHLADGGSNRLSNLVLLCEDCHNARHDHDITDGRDDDTAPQSEHTTRNRRTSSGSWFWRFVGYNIGALICLACQFFAVSTLIESPVGTPYWLASGGYMLLLLGTIAVRSRQITVLYGLAGGYWLVLSYVVPKIVTSSILATGFVLLWVPAGLAGGVWLLRRWHTATNRRDSRTNGTSGTFDDWN